MSFADLEIEGGSDYIKLVSGGVVNFHILSQNPEKQAIHWMDRKKTKCPGKDCEFCLNGDRPKQRWTCDVWDRKDQKVKKFEFGSMVAGQLKAIAEMLAESQQTVHDIDIRIKTSGSGLETEYSVLHVPINGVIPLEIKDRYSVPF